MPFGLVTLIPGVNVDRTPTLNQAGISQSSLIRFKDGLVQKFGGWSTFYPLNLAGVPRDMHAWQDLNSEDHLFVGTTQQAAVITNGTLENLTPQTLLSNTAPQFTTTIGSAQVEVRDPNIANVTTFDSVFFNTPISVGGLILAGLYTIDVITGVSTYKITANKPATAAVVNGGAVPQFSTTNLTSVVGVLLNANTVVVGNNVAFSIPTSGNGVTIFGGYSVINIVDANNFQILVSQQANASGSFNMNGGNAQLLYYLALGPSAAGSGYGLGGYGLGGYGTGVVNAGQTGTPITPEDWTSDNWGQILLACPANAVPYYWDPTGGFTNMSPIPGAPTFCSGIFVSTSAQIMVAYGTSIDYLADGTGFGVVQDPLLVSWSDSGNFFDWVATDENLAGNYRLSNGSEIRAGMALSNQNLIWTDLDVWSMNFIGYPSAYGFNKIGAGAGAANRHAVQTLRGGVHWMGASNFYQYAGGGVSVVPCPVWDAVFQNLNMDFIQNVRAMPNTPFNEVGYFYPSLASVNGENDSYVKYNITEPGLPWDIGPAGAIYRSAWIDQSVFGSSPIGANNNGRILQQETTNDIIGQPMPSSFTTGYFYLAEGEDFVFVDQVIPDMKWGTYAGPQTAVLQFTFFVVNEPSDTPLVYGPYTVTRDTPMFSTRFRGRQAALKVESNDLGSFWRLGKIRYRYAPVGRR